MSSRQAELARRREALLVRAEMQRVELSERYRQFGGTIQLAETVLNFARSLRRSPLFITGLTVLLVRTPWRKLARYPKWAWRGWKTWQWVRSWTAPSRARRQQTA